MTNNTKERFMVSTEGMAELHKDRQPWALIKELVANAWDEDSSDRCEVNITPISGTGGVLVTVEDNGTGFSDIKDSFTLLAPSNKRGQLNKRGRFNVGEKEIISIAISARVITPGTTITFPKGGGRRSDKNARTRGTIIEAVMDWNTDIIPETVDMLGRFIAPMDETYIINGSDYSMSPPVQTNFRSRLRTTVQTKPGRPMTAGMRMTDVIVREVNSGESGWLLEMGIPVQEIEPNFLIDIQQKIPLSQMRDMAPEGYLHTVYAELLNEVADIIPEADAGASWIHAALSETDRISEDAIKTVVRSRYGDKVAMWSSDLQANEDAQQDGYTVLHPNALSVAERGSIKQVVSTSLELFPDVTGLRGTEDVEPTAAMQHIAKYAKWLADALMGIDIDVQFKKAPKQAGSGWLARYNEGAKMMAFNVQLLGTSWFKSKITAEHTSLIIHELAHEGESKSHHQGEYVHRLADLGAQATHLALTSGRTEWFK